MQFYTSEVPLYRGECLVLHNLTYSRLVLSHYVFGKSFCKSQFPHKSVNLSFTLVIVKDKLTILWGS